MTLSSFLRPTAWLGLLLLCTANAFAQGSTTPPVTKPDVPAPPAATDPVGDPRIKAQLDSLKYKYSVNKIKTYELTFDLASKRSQTVFINSTTEKFDKLETRDVTSTAYKIKGKMTSELALRFLADNDRRKWGAWRTTEVNGYTYLIYAVQIPADASAETLDYAMSAVMNTADEIEKELATEDSF